MGRHLARAAWITACLTLGLPAPGTAESLSLARVLDVVRAQNPTIAGANARADAAAAIPGRMRAWDDPVVSWESWNVPESIAIDQADNNILRLSQRIPFPGKRTLAGEMAAREAEAMHHDAGAVELDALTRAKRAYAELWRAQRSLAVMRRDAALAERTSRLVAQRYATGGAEQTDVLMAEVEVSHAEGTLRTAALAIDEAWAVLAAVMSVTSDDLPPTVAAPPDPWLPDTAITLVERALQERPEVAAREATIARETTGARLAGKGYLPDFEVSVGRFLNHDTANGFGAMASMTVPLAWKSKYDAGVAEANARIIAAEADRRGMTDEVRRDVMQAFLRAKAALVQHDLLARTHVPHAEQALRVTEAAYVAGGPPLTTLLATVRELERVHLEHVAAAAEFAKAYADLERAVGVDLPRRSGEAGREEHRHD